MTSTALSGQVCETDGSYVSECCGLRRPLGKGLLVPRCPGQRCPDPAGARWRLAVMAVPASFVGVE